MYMRDDYGAVVRLVGYAAVWHALSSPFSDGHREFIDRRGFDSIMDGRPMTVRCLAHHNDDLDLGEALIWTDDVGLAFRSTPLTATAQNSAILGSIVGGSVRGVSWCGKFETLPQETLQGVATRRIRRVVHLDHVGPVGIPRYKEPGCWASYEDIHRLPHHLQLLAEHWERSEAQAGQSTMTGGHVAPAAWRSALGARPGRRAMLGRLVVPTY